MFTSNPFAELSASVPPAVMQTYVVVMVLFVAGGTLFDIIHKRSARYFFNNWRASGNKAKQPVGGGDMISLAVQTALVDVLTSGEFCNARRRIAHLLGMYGFVIYVVTTAIMVFSYPTPATPAPVVLAALVVHRRADGLPRRLLVLVFHPRRCCRRRQFTVSLRASGLVHPDARLSTTFGLIWAWLQTAGNTTWAAVFLGLYLIATTVLFASIPWSKFSHMFFKPAAALEKRLSEANGTRSNLPAPADAPEKFGTATSMRTLLIGLASGFV